MRRSVVSGFISILGGKFGTLLLGLLTTPILVRLLGSSLYGDYAFLLSLLAITMIITNAGIFDGTRKYIAENRDQEYWTEHIFVFYLQLALAFATLACSAYILFARLGFASQILGPEFTIYLYLFSVLIIGRQAYEVARGGLMGLGLENWSESLKVLKKVLFAALGLSLAFFGYGVVGVLVGKIIADVLASCIAFIVLSRHLQFHSIIHRIPSDLPMKELVSFNFLSVILFLLTASMYHVDILLVRLMIGSDATGYYQAALVIAEFLWFVPNALQIVLLHSTSELWSKGKSDSVTALISKITRYNLCLLLLLAIGLSVLAYDFVPLYFGADFVSSVPALLLLLPGVIGFGLARPIYAVGQGKGDLTVLIAGTGGASVLNIILNLILIPVYGMVGAAVATSIGYGSMFMLHVIAARYIGYDPTDNLAGGRIGIIAVITGAVLFGTSNYVSSPIISLIIIPPLGFVLYTTLCVKMGVIFPEDLEKLKQKSRFLSFVLSKLQSKPQF